MHLVVCVDGSQGSDLALDHAVALADATDGRLTLVHAVDPQVYESPGAGPIADRPDAEDRGQENLVVEAVADAEDRGQEILEAAVDRVGELETEADLVYGDPVDAIATYAEDRGDVDEVVVGHRAVGERYERVLGSVAKGLVERAPVPVTVVREP